jgi:hypothetical protein
MISPALDSNKFQKDNRLMSGYPIELLSEKNYLVLQSRSPLMGKAIFDLKSL